MTILLPSFRYSLSLLSPVLLIQSNQPLRTCKRLEGGFARSEMMTSTAHALQQVPGQEIPKSYTPAASQAGKFQLDSPATSEHGLVSWLQWRDGGVPRTAEVHLPPADEREPHQGRGTGGARAAAEHVVLRTPCLAAPPTTTVSIRAVLAC